jgi:hypothetical protein
MQPSAAILGPSVQICLLLLKQILEEKNLLRISARARCLIT